VVIFHTLDISSFVPRHALMMDNVILTLPLCTSTCGVRLFQHRRSLRSDPINYLVDAESEGDLRSRHPRVRPPRFDRHPGP
jgi:hypothetical protein